MHLEDFDEVCRNEIGRVLYVYGVEKYLVLDVKSLHDGCMACLREREGWSVVEHFGIKRRLSQGCVMT